MRKLRQDEIDLINRVRRRNIPLITSVKNLIKETDRTIKALTDDPSDSLPHRFPGLLEINDHPIFHPDQVFPPTSGPRCKCTLVPTELIKRIKGKVLNGPRPFGMSDAQVLNYSSDEIAEMVHNEPPQTLPVPVEELPQEETLEQIKRMVDHLPVTNECPEDASGCLRLGDLMISKWAREFLKQMIKEKEGS